MLNYFAIANNYNTFEAQRRQAIFHIPGIGIKSFLLVQLWIYVSLL